MTPMPPGRAGFVSALAVCALVGVGAVVAGLATTATSSATNAPVSKPVPTEEYGRRLVAHTAELLGQDQTDPSLRYINSRLNCASCHLSAEIGRAHV